MRTLEPGLHLRSYRLIHRLGRGGDGDVWLAVDTRGREVALKARPRGDGSDEQRLRREFERLRTLRLPSVIRVLDVGADQGYTFFTMEVARGLSFDRYVAEAPSLDARVRRAAQAGAGVAHALAGIHRLGLAHRDLKPANVMVDAHGVVTLLDFGNVRFGNAQDDSGEFLGTLSYMAPEQRLGLPHDHRVDCYALGVTLYTALTGTPASLGAPGRPRTSLALLGREVPLGLAWLVDRLLALDPARRPTAEEAEAVMTAVARGEPLPPAPWPEPPSYAGDPSPLLNSSGVVSGAAGSGRRRMVAEARWQWYRRGYRSFAGLCREDTPYGALRSVLTELFATPDPTERRRLAGEDGPALAAIWPDLPVPVRALSWPPDAHDVALSLARVFGRVAPAAIVLWDLDRADPGTQAVLPTLAAALPDRIRLWGTSRRPVPGLRRIAPPGWGPDQEAMILPELLPDGTAPVGPAGLTPLHSMARAWCALARWRGEAGPAFPPPLPLVALAVLDEPFPRKVAELLVGDLGQLIEAGHLGPPRGAQARMRGVGPEARPTLAPAKPSTASAAINPR